MSDEASSGLIQSYKEQIAALQADNNKLRNEAAKRRHKNQELQAKLDEVTEDRNTLALGFEELEAKHKELETRTSTAPSELQAENAALKQQIRTRDHKEVFKRLAMLPEHGVREEAVNDLWDLSGYKAEGESADEAKMQELIKAKLIGRDHFKRPTVETTTAAADAAQAEANAKAAANAAIKTPATPPGPGAARTTSDTTPAAVQTVLDRVNREFAKHSITGNDGRL